MFHLIQDPDDNSYLLLETVRANTAYIYRTAEDRKCWLPLSVIPTTVQTPDESPENFRSWKASSNYNFIKSSLTLSGIYKFINNHPELLI